METEVDNTTSSIQMPQEWWERMRKAAAQSQSRDEFDRRTRPMLVKVHHALQTMEGVMLPENRKADLRELRRLARCEFYKVNGIHRRPEPSDRNLPSRILRRLLGLGGA